MNARALQKVSIVRIHAICRRQLPNASQAAHILPSKIRLMFPRKQLVGFLAAKCSKVPRKLLKLSKCPQAAQAVKVPTCCSSCQRAHDLPKLSKCSQPAEAVKVHTTCPSCQRVHKLYSSCQRAHNLPKLSKCSQPAQAVKVPTICSSCQSAHNLYSSCQKRSQAEQAVEVLTNL